MAAWLLAACIHAVANQTVVILPQASCCSCTPACKEPASFPSCRTLLCHAQLCSSAGRQSWSTPTQQPSLEPSHALLRR